MSAHARTPMNGTLDADGRASEVPADPTAPGQPFPRLADDAHDGALESLAAAAGRDVGAPVRWARAFAIVVALGFAFTLRHELAFAMSAPTPIELGSHPSVDALAAAEHRLVAIDGVPGGVGAIDYRRPLPSSPRRLAPLVDTPAVYADLAMRGGVDPTRFVPPTRVVGRLAPLDDAGVRYRNVRSLIEASTGRPAPAQLWVLETGAAPAWSAPGPMLALGALAVAAVLAIAVALDRRRASSR
jgi:hypothetical protein